MPSKAAFLKSRLEGMKSVLEKATPKEKEQRVTTHMAKEFNTILTEIGSAYPDATSQLPKPILSTTKLRFLGQSDVGYVDLQMMVEQVLRILSLVESDG
jgi:hypothetical protein